MGDWLQMDLKSKKESKLYVLLLKYLFVFSGIVLILMITFMSMFVIFMNKGILLPANYAEHKINENREVLKSSEPFDESAVPLNCSYGLFDSDHNYIEGNLEDDDISEVVKVLDNSSFVNGRYEVIEREDDICVVKYDVQAHFASPAIHKIIKKPETFFPVTFLILFFVVLFVMAVTCGKRINKQLAPLLKATDNIKNQELEFDVEYSDIKEFNDVLKSIDDMKKALEESLKEQWKTEQNKKTYISAIAHDIKTPLTIIKGNTELMAEEDMTGETIEYTESINKNCEKIQHYISQLIDTVKSNEKVKCNFKKIKLKNLIDEIAMQGEEICIIKNIDFEYNFKDDNYNITCDKSLLTRAVVNLIDNAAHHSEEKSRILLNVSVIKDRVYIVVDDFGSGFSKEALKNAKEQFFTENTERSKNHYGLGMYIANSIAESHGGNLQYINKENEKGARVWMEIPLK